MAKRKPPVKKRDKKIKPKERKTLFQRLNAFFEKRHHTVGLIITGLSLLMALMMFDAKVSTGLDDSTYIEQGWKYSKDFFNHYFTSQAPFYAMFLAIPISLVGINLVVLKLINVVLFVLSVYLFYRAFRNRVSWWVLFGALFIYATNTEALRMASLTYTEAMYLFLQSLFFVLSLRLLERLDGNTASYLKIIKDNALTLIALGTTFFLLYLTRTVGIAALGVFLVYFLVSKQWKALAISTGSLVASYLVYSNIIKAIWKNTNQFSTQFKILSQKDAYDASLGYEDFSGFIVRALENTNQYFSARLYEIMGFREFPSDWNWGLTLFIVVPLLLAMFKAYKAKERAVFFGLLYVGAICGFTFLALQTSWGQARYIMILLTPMFIGLFWLIEKVFQKERLVGYQFFGVIIALVFILNNFFHSFGLANANIPVARANLLENDRYKGYNPDWENYLKLSEWCGDSLDESSLVAARKAPMSFIYSGGKEFFPIWSTLPNPDPDSTLRSWKERGVTHVIVANLRATTNSAQYGIINTVHRVLQPIQEKYPESLNLIKKQGESEEAVLVELDYSKTDIDK